MEKLEQPIADFKVNLKSTGIDKFALEGEKKEEEKVNFRDQLKSVKERDDNAVDE